MFVLIVEHDYAEWDVTIHANRSEAEQAIRLLTQAKWDDDEFRPPRHIVDCIDHLATCNEYVKVFRGTHDGNLCEPIDFDAPIERAA